MKALVLALLLAAVPLTAVADPGADLAISASDPGTVPDVTEFTVTFTVTNVGTAPGKALVTQSSDRDGWEDQGWLQRGRGRLAPC